MTMTLQGMRDSLEVKLNAALKALDLRTYTRPNDDQAYNTLAVCTVSVDENDPDIQQVSVVVEKVKNGCLFSYRLDVRLKYGVYTVTDQTHHNETVDDGTVVAACGKYHTSDKLTAGREVVDYIVAKVCYFMGTAGDV